MRVLISVAASLLLMLALVGPVAAAPGRGCSDFGTATVGFAQAGGFGQIVSGVARGDPGGASWLILTEHEEMCAHP